MADENKNVNAEAQEAEEKKEQTPSNDELLTRIKELETLLDQSKQAYNNASSDAASWKKKFRETQDDATRAEAERNEELESLRKQIEEANKRETVSRTTADLIAMGYPKDLAEKRAAYLADGDHVNAMAVEKQFLEYHDKEMKAAAVRNTPAPASGFPANSPVTREQFQMMSLRDRTQLKNEHPELYAEFTKK